MSYVIRKGTTRKLLLVHVRDAEHGAGMTGLRPTTPGASAGYFREGAREPRRVPLVRSRLGEHIPGGMAEADPELMPGVYQIGLPDAMLEGGADSVMFSLVFPGAVVEPIHLALVAYDPQDEKQMGMTSLTPEGRITALRGAFPRVAARELDEMQARLDDSRKA